jgi:MerR-like DNA binding protein
MPAQPLISLNDFCSNHSIEISFVNTLHDYGLISITVVEDIAFIDLNQLPVLEKIVRLHYDLEINLPGIETIHHLLQRIHTMQEEMTILKNRLQRYENN